jgi:Zn-finger nucleic acid-binding protein
VEAASGLFLDVCRSGCQGIWLDNRELEAIDEAHEHPEAPVLRLVESTPQGTGVLSDSAAKRPCPRCEGVKLQRHWFSWRREVQVDRCGQCGGYWLDTGELDRIRAEYRSAEAREAEAERRASAMLAEQEADQEARLRVLRERDKRRGVLGRTLDSLVANVAEWL